MTGDCKASVMESRTGEALGLMLWADGDGVLAPLVLAMAKVERFQRVVRGVFFFKRTSSRLPLERVL